MRSKSILMPDIFQLLKVVGTFLNFQCIQNLLLYIDCLFTWKTSNWYITMLMMMLMRSWEEKHWGRRPSSVFWQKNFTPCTRWSHLVPPGTTCESWQVWKSGSHVKNHGRLFFFFFLIPRQARKVQKVQFTVLQIFVLPNLGTFYWCTRKKWQKYVIFLM